MPKNGRKFADGKADSTANLGFEAKLWLVTDKLRNNMDAAEYKHVVLGLIFLKYIASHFGELTVPLMAKIKANADQSHTLATLLDTLLPKLLSGELSVGNQVLQP